MTVSKEIRSKLEDILAKITDDGLKHPESLEEAIAVVGKHCGTEYATTANANALLAMVFPDGIGDELRVLEGSTKPAEILRDFASGHDLNGVYRHNRTLLVRFKDPNSEDVILCEPKSSAFKEYSVALHYAHFKDMMSEATYRKIVLNISSLPVTEVELSRRVAERFNAFYFNLSDGTGQVVKITKTGWRVMIPSEPIFLWVDHAKPAFMPEPVEDPIAVLNQLWKMLNQDKKYVLLQKIAFLFSFLPLGPQPISVIHGEHGSAKSYYSKVWKRFVDPSLADNTSMVDDKTELAHLLGANWFVAFDNVSGIKQFQSDMLCQASTGGATQVRKLYTDGDSFSRDLRSVVVLNGINVTPNQPDLLRRCILFFFPHITAEARMSETFINEQIDAIGPKVMGAVFRLISIAMNKVDQYRIMANKPIMADFAIWGCALADALGESSNEFLVLYEQNRSLQSEEVIRNDQVGTVLKEILDEGNFVDGLFMLTKENLLGSVTSRTEMINKSLIHDKWFPKTTMALVRKMERLRPTLRELGYEYTEERRRFGGIQQRVFVFKKKGTLIFPNAQKNEDDEK